MSLEGKVGVVTGAARGIGSAIAEALLQKGAKVCIADIIEAGKDTVTQFNEKYGKGKAIFVKCDVTSKTDMENLFDKVKSEFGLPDIFCNNAGIQDDENYELTIQVNLIAVIRATRMAIDRMSKSNGGNGGLILNVASIGGLICHEGMPVYAASKHGVIGWTRSLAMARDVNEKNGITLQTLCPSFVLTDMVMSALEEVPAEKRDAITEFIEKNEGFLSTDECAAGAMRLLDDDVESGSALIVGKVRGQYFHNFDDSFKL